MGALQVRHDAQQFGEGLGLPRGALVILGNREDSPPHLHEAPGANGGSHLLGVDAAGREVSADSLPALGVLAVEVLLRARFGEERKHAQGDEGRTRGVARDRP